MSIGRAPTGKSGFGAGVGLAVNGANLDNTLIAGLANGSQTIIGGLTAGNALSLTADVNQGGKINLGTITAPSYYLNRSAAQGDDYLQLRTGKTSAGLRQPLTVSNRGAALGDDVCIGFTPVYGATDEGGSTVSKTRIQATRYDSPVLCHDLSFFINENGTATEMIRLDGPRTVSRFMRGLAIVRASKTGTYAVTDADTLILADAAGGAFDVTIPSAVGRDGQLVGVMRTGATNTVTVKSAGGTLNGVAAATGIPLTSQFMSRWFCSDNTNWFAVFGLL